MDTADRLHIALFTNVFLPSTNGVVTSVCTFRDALTELGHNVFVMAPSGGDYEDRIPFVFRYPSVELPAQKYPLTLPVSSSVDEFLPALKPDILHANHPALLGKVAENKSEELDVPLVFTYHTRYREYSHYASLLPEDKLKEFIEHWLGSFMSHCHQIVVPSESIRKMVEDTYGVTEGVSVVATGVDTNRFGKTAKGDARKSLGWDPEERILVSMGRLAKEKNFDLLIEAFAKVDHARKRLVILGEGEERAALEQQISEFGLGEQVCLTGLVTKDEVPTYLSASDLFVFGSVTETQGLVTLEAMASGLPTVAVAASGTQDVVVDGETGFLTEVHAASLAEGIERLLLSPEQMRSFGAAGRRRAAEFGHLSQAKKMLSAYERAIQAHAQRKRVIPHGETFESHWHSLLDRLRI